MHSQSTLVQLPLFALDKRCAQCGVQGPLEDFYRQSAAPDGHHRWCKSCCGAYQERRYAAKGDELRAGARTYYHEHREERLAYDRRYKNEHREELCARSRAYRAANPEKVKERQQRWYKAHRAEQVAAAAAWNKAHPEFRRAYWPRHYAQNAERYRLRAAQWREANPERYRARGRLNNARRLVRARVAEGSFSAADIQVLEATQAGLCAYCGEPYGAYHLDHKRPLSRGGSNWPDNLCLSCSACNLSKGAKTDQEFRAWLALRATHMHSRLRL